MTMMPAGPDATPKPKPKNTDFFVGYGKRWPDALQSFLPACAAALVAIFVTAGLLIGLSQRHPGDGGFRWDLGQQTLVGTLELNPVPVIHARPTSRFPNGHTMMLTGQGKNGVQVAAAPLDGMIVEAKGFITERGALDMLVVDTLEAGKSASLSSDDAVRSVTDLGRWRLTGEICDGKCVSGAMRPGRGIAHKACANLCILGGVPPVFVANGTVVGKSFFLMADDTGQPLAERLGDLTAVPVEIEARVQRRGDLLIVLINPMAIKRL